MAITGDGNHAACLDQASLVKQGWVMHVGLDLVVQAVYLRFVSISANVTVRIYNPTLQ